MPLILAIEPDRRQGAHLSAVIRRRVTAELILVGTTQAALDAIGNRVPDLVLVPALLSPQDDAALAAALRVIAAAAHVQMLTIPVLGASRPASRAGGMLAALRRDKSRAAEPDGCDPSVFAEQIASYLERAAEEHAAEAELADHEPQPVAAQPETIAADAPAVVAAAAPDLVDPALIDFLEPLEAQGREDAEQGGEDSVSAALEEAMRALFISDGPAPVPPDEPIDEAIEETIDEPVEDSFDPPVQVLAAPPPVEEPAWAPFEPLPEPARLESPALMAAESLAVDDFMRALEALPLTPIEAVVDPWSGRIIDEVDEPIENADQIGTAVEDGEDLPGNAMEVTQELVPVEARAAQEVRPVQGGSLAPEARPAPEAAPAARSELEWVALIESLRRGKAGHATGGSEAGADGEEVEAGAGRMGPVRSGAVRVRGSAGEARGSH
jgi:hypothetical protein